MESNVTSLKPAPAHLHQNRPDRHFNIVIAGEFNAGKSSVVNLLLRRQVMPVTVGYTHMPPVRVFPSTQEVYHVLSAGNAPLARKDFLNGHIPGAMVRSARIEMPIKDFNGATITEVSVGQHGELDPEAEAALRSADLLVWCTMGQRAWCLTEITVVEKLPPRLLRNAILVVTRMDYMKDASDKAKIMSRLEREAGRYFRVIVPVSASQKALRRLDDTEHWTNSGGQELHKQIMAQFSQSEHFGRPLRTAELEDIGKFRQQTTTAPNTIFAIREAWNNSISEMESWIDNTPDADDREILAGIKARLQTFSDTFCATPISMPGKRPIGDIFVQAISRISQELASSTGKATVGVDIVLQLEEELQIRTSETV